MLSHDLEVISARLTLLGWKPVKYRWVRTLYRDFTARRRGEGSRVPSSGWLYGLSDGTQIVGTKYGNVRPEPVRIVPDDMEIVDVEWWKIGEMVLRSLAATVDIEGYGGGFDGGYDDA